MANCTSKTYSLLGICVAADFVPHRSIAPLPLFPHPRGQQVSRKTACKNAEFREWDGVRSTGRNEKPHGARGSAGLSSSQRLVCYSFLAEKEGFEPSIQVLPRCALSRGVPSTTRPLLRRGAMITTSPPLVKLRQAPCRVQTPDARPGRQVRDTFHPPRRRS